MGRELFFAVSRIYFGPTMLVGLAVEVEWFESLTSLGDRFENFEAEECFQRECHGETLSGKETKEVISLCVHDEVFWTEDLIEETTKGLHDSYTILTLIEHDMSAQLNSSLPNLIPRVFVLYYTFWLSERRCSELESPYPELQEGSPNSNPDGRA